MSLTSYRAAPPRAKCMLQAPLSEAHADSVMFASACSCMRMVTRSGEDKTAGLHNTVRPLPQKPLGSDKSGPERRLCNNSAAE